VRFAVARHEGLTEDRVELIAPGFEASDLTGREKAVIRYVDRFLADPSGLTDPQRAELLEHFTPDQVVELTAGIALFMGFSKIAIALGPPPDMPTLVIPTPGADAPGPDQS
jgi:alkylhydroperoxidase family enzyme